MCVWIYTHEYTYTQSPEMVTKSPGTKLWVAVSSLVSRINKIKFTFKHRAVRLKNI